MNIENMFPDSDVLEKDYWEKCNRNELRDLIMKFASAENHERNSGGSINWNQCRLQCVEIFKIRFGSVPSSLSNKKLPDPFGDTLFDEEVTKWW